MNAMNQAVEINEQIQRVVDYLQPLTTQVETTRQVIREIENDIEARKLGVTDELVNQEGGFKKLGSNAEERHHTIEMAIAQDDTIQRLTAKLWQYQAELARVEAEYKNYSRQYGALCYRAALVASILRFYTGTEEPSPDMNPNGSQGYELTREDVAGLGL